MIVDGHAHAFLRADRQPRAVDELAPADREAPVEDLLTVMAGAGVDSAVLVPLATEDRYVAAALRDHPGRFAAVAVADAAIHGRERGVDPVAALQRRREGFAFHAVRTQWLGDAGAPLAESPMLPALMHMAETGLLLWTYPTRDQLELLEELPEAVPDLRIVLNHLGFCPHGMRVDAHRRPAFDEPFPAGSLEPVLRLARHPNTYVMFSGQYALSHEAPPYRDLDAVVGRLADAFGPRRMVWASDYPWTRNVPGYSALLTLAEEALPGASPADLAAIHGETALELFPQLRPAEAI
jgi:predicted TIM-barrel fold metal-dependent hydrolase